MAASLQLSVSLTSWNRKQCTIAQVMSYLNPFCLLYFHLAREEGRVPQVPPSTHTQLYSLLPRSKGGGPPGRLALLSEAQQKISAAGCWLLLLCQDGQDADVKQIYFYPACLGTGKVLHSQ